MTDLRGTVTDLRAAAYGVLCGMVLEDGRRWDDTAATYQRANALAILDLGAPVRQHWIELPRGARKTTDLAAILLAVLLVQAPAQARCYIGASDEEQAQEIIDAAQGLIARTPELAGHFHVHELEITNVATGASVRALAADASAMGKRAWMIVLDEVTNWPDTRKARKFWGVLTSGNRKIAECRTVVLANAGVPEHWSWERRETARRSRHWSFCSVPGPLPWLTEADLQVLRENAETPSEFDRLHLNVWCEAEDSLATRADIEACAHLADVPRPRQAGCRYAAAVDLATVNDNAVAVVGHLEGDRRVVIDAMRVWTPRRGEPITHADVEEHLRELCSDYAAELVFDPAEMRGMAQRLELAGVTCVEFRFTTAAVGKLGVLLNRLLRDRQIDLPADVDLVDELAHVRLRRTGPGQYRLDHDPGRHDDRAVAIAMLATHLLENYQDTGVRFIVGDEPTSTFAEQAGVPVLIPLGPTMGYIRSPEVDELFAEFDEPEQPKRGAVMASPWA